MKIVGLISDENEINEMETTAKIFVVEQRMRNLKYSGKLNKIIYKKDLKIHEKINMPQTDLYKRQPILNVRGFN